MGEEKGANTRHALYPTQFFLTVEYAVEFRRARPRHGQHLINIPLPCVCTRTCTTGLHEVLYVLTLILHEQCVPSASLEPPSPNYSLHLKLCSHQQNALSKTSTGRTQRTGVSMGLVQPLSLFFPVLSLPPPSRNPRLLLVVPEFLVALLRLDAFSVSEAFPFGWGFWFRFRQRLGAEELCCWVRAFK